MPPRRELFSTITGSSGGLELAWRDQFPPAKEPFEGLAENSVPAFE
jgi:hypothetical protein